MISIISQSKEDMKMVMIQATNYVSKGLNLKQGNKPFQKDNKDKSHYEKKKMRNKSNVTDLEGWILI